MFFQNKLVCLYLHILLIMSPEPTQKDLVGYKNSSIDRSVIDEGKNFSNIAISQECLQDFSM
jgi:hypothetical protein